MVPASPGLRTQREASREAALEQALPSAKSSPNQPQNPLVGLLRATAQWCHPVSRCPCPASAAGTASPVPALGLGDAEPTEHPSQKRD